MHTCLHAILLVLSWICPAAVAFAGSPVVLKGDVTTDLGVSDAIDYYVESDSEHLAEDVGILSRLSEFKKLPADSRLGRQAQPLWFTFEIFNQSERSQDFFVNLPHQVFWKVKLLTVRASGRVESQGESVIDNSLGLLEFPTTNMSFRVYVPQGERVRLLFYSLTNGPIDLTTRIHSTVSFIRTEYIWNIVNGIFYGIMIGLILYNSFIFFILKDRAYLYYVMWAIALVLFFSTLNGVSMTILGPGFGSINRLLTFLFIGLFLLFEAKALTSFLTNLDAPMEQNIKTVAVGLSFSVIGASLITLFVDFERSVTLTNYMSAAGTVVMLLLIYLGYRSSRKGFGPANLLLLANLPFAVTTILRGISQVGLVDSIFRFNIVHQVSAAVEMVLMSMALADRIYYITVQHREAEAEKEEILLKNRYLQEQERLHAKENEAIMKTTQMLAHDVRKPFSILRMGLTMLLNNREIERMPDLLAKMLPEVDRAAKAADGLIADVMEIGSSQQLVFEDICPTELIRGTLYEAFRIYPSANIQIEFDSQHTHEIRANAAKLQRVFSNIYTNALQAMGASGRTWFRTRNIRLKGKSFVEFCIGNSGSFIPAENIGKIFEAFFTDGKPSGTGLGLAISRKVVAAHGGSIWCESSKSAEFPNGKVQFFFTIPASMKKANKTRIQLPTQSKDFTAAVFAESDHNESNGFRTSIAQQELELEGAILATSAELGRRLHIVLIDDEPIYIEALRQDFSRSGKLAEIICIDNFETAADALQFVSASKADGRVDARMDLIICDIDLGRESIDGFELVRRIRDQDGAFIAGSFICLHSNRMVADDHRLAISSGADAFLAKPAARAQILKLLLQAAQRANDSYDLPTAAGGCDVEESSPEVAIIEDNPFIAEAWSATLVPDAVAHFANSPEEFLSQISSDDTLLERLVCVVVDQHFDQSSSDGISLARFIKSQRPDLRVLLSSDGHLSEQEIDGAIDRQISKTPVKLNRLLR